MVATIRFHELGGPEVLRYEDLPVRAPGPGEVRLRVDAIGLNRAEVNFRRGTYVEQPVLPAGLGMEASGEVLEAGPGVERWVPGDFVSVVPSFSRTTIRSTPRRRSSRRPRWSRARTGWMRSWVRRSGCRT